MKETAYLSLGSNIAGSNIAGSADRAENLRAAIRRLEEAGTVCAVSSFYETEPVEVRDQPWFLNCVVAVETFKSPQELLKNVLSIEEAMGRVRTRVKGPRIIDIDIVLFGNRIVDEPGLQIPHPAMHQRRFVLEPLAEIAPQVSHPILRKTAAELLSALGAGEVVRRINTLTE
ncbi:MAG: 2-amino-4-hydroxy-6-hydroxymethyldihydropteridine diphosphokinase [Terriglobales bacterium]